MFETGDTIGTAPRCFSIEIINDTAVENNEMFFVDLPSDGLIHGTGITSANVTIIEDITDSKINVISKILILFDSHFFSSC